MIALLLAVTVQSFAHLPLAQAESAGVAHSPDVAASTAKVAEEQALFNAARASYGPALTANYAASPQGGNQGQTVEQQLTTVGAQLSLGDLLAYAPAVAQANAALAAARFDLLAAQRNERITVIDEYYAALAAHGVVSAREVESTSAQSELHAAELRFRAGDAPRLDVVRASVALAQAQADLVRAQADAQNADATLALETGMRADRLTIVSAQAPNTAPPAIDPARAVAQALALRPEIASARANVTAEERAVALARRGGVPIITLAGGYTKGIDTGVAVAGPSANVQVTLPLGGAAHDRVLAEQARLAQAQAALVKAQRDVENAVGAAARTLDAQNAALAASERALSSARAEFAATEIGYRSGASSSLDVENARTTYVQALVNETSAYYQRAQAQATMELLMGAQR